jgi:hypothetical protein
VLKYTKIVVAILFHEIVFPSSKFQYNPEMRNVNTSVELQLKYFFELAVFSCNVAQSS